MSEAGSEDFPQVGSENAEEEEIVAEAEEIEDEVVSSGWDWEFLIVNTCLETESVIDDSQIREL